MKKFVFKDIDTGEVVLELEKNGTDSNGNLQSFIGKFPITGLSLTDPYLIGAMLAERSNVSEDEMKKVRIPQKFYGRIPAGELVYIMTHGILNNLQVAEETWSDCFIEAFNGIRTLADITIAYKWVKENDILYRISRYMEKCKH